MLFTVGLSHVITTLTAHVKSAFSLGYVQNVRLYLWRMHEDWWKLPAFHKVQWIHFTGEVDRFIIIWCDVSSGFRTPKITKIGSFFSELILKKNQGLKHGVQVSVSTFVHCQFILVVSVSFQWCFSLWQKSTCLKTKSCSFERPVLTGSKPWKLGFE